MNILTTYGARVLLDGTLVPLGSLTRLREALSFTVRHGKPPSSDHPLVILDLYAEGSQGLFPVGHYDWEIHGDVAVGNKSRHGHFDTTTPEQKAADRLWSSNAFEVDGITFERLAIAMAGNAFTGRTQWGTRGIKLTIDELFDPAYQGQGLGRLLIVLSAIALKRLGHEKLDLGHRSPAALSSWRIFGSVPTDAKNVQIAPSAVLDDPAAQAVLEKLWK